MARPHTRIVSDRTRGLSTPATVAALVAALVLLGAGYAIGRMSGADSGASRDGGGTPPGETGDRVAAPAGSNGNNGSNGSIGSIGSIGSGRDPDHVHAPGDPAHPHSGTPVDALAGPAPIEFDPPILDFGVVPPDEEMRGVIRIVNTSDRPQTILKMQPDCKCTTVEDLSGRTIPARGSIELTAVMEGRTTTGVKKSKIKFAFDGYQDISEVDISSYVRRQITSEPAYIEPEGGTVAGDIRVYSVDEKPFSVTAVNGEPPVFADDFDPEADPPRAEYTLRWDISRYNPQTCLDTQGRRMPKWWIIETDDSETPIVDLFVRHAPCSLPEPRRGRRWVLSKQRALLDEIAVGEPADFDVYLKWLGHEVEPNDSIREVRSETAQFTARLLSTERDGERITCRVRITPAAHHRGLLYGNVRFYGYNQGHTQALPVIARVVEADRSTASR